jgi:hypothetical protein
LIKRKQNSISFNISFENLIENKEFQSLRQKNLPEKIDIICLNLFAEVLQLPKTKMGSNQFQEIQLLRLIGMMPKTQKG